jgi:hypothetical protein
MLMTALIYDHQACQDEARPALTLGTDQSTPIRLEELVLPRNQQSTRNSAKPR